MLAVAVEPRLLLPVAQAAHLILPQGVAVTLMAMVEVNIQMTKNQVNQAADMGVVAPVAEECLAFIMAA